MFDFLLFDRNDYPMYDCNQVGTRFKNDKVCLNENEK